MRLDYVQFDRMAKKADAGVEWMKNWREMLQVV
jgi:hypothetical protein